MAHMHKDTDHAQQEPQPDRAHFMSLHILLKQGYTRSFEMTRFSRACV